MVDEPPRIAEVKMLVIVLVNLADAELPDAIAATGENPLPLSKLVSSEVLSNLESVSYVETAFVSPL